MPITLSELNIYPIKSAGGIAMRSAEVTDRGLRLDRRWMLVDSSGRFITQREFPRMALLGVGAAEERLTVDAPGMATLEISSSAWPVSPKSVTVWNDVVDAVPVGDVADKWFSQFLETPCQLVFMPDHARRAVDDGFALHGEIVSFADAFPLLLISEASLEDLNNRMPLHLPMNRFRPNLVVGGCDAYAEDTWHEIAVGDVGFRVVKPCARCAITTVDQRTGIRGEEPLRTLASYRKRDGKVLFGQNLIHAATGVLQTGGEVRILA